MGTIPFPSPDSRRIKVGLVSGILHPKYGGPSAVVRAHVDALRKYADVTVFGVAGSDEKREVAAVFPEARLFDKCFPARWFYGKGLARELRKAAPSIDIFHAHMLWDHPVYAAWKAARSSGIPLIVTPHGSISAPWRHTQLHKRLYRQVVIDRMFGECTMLHVLTPAEKSACLDYGVTCPVYVVPNGLPESEYMREREPGQALEQWPSLRGRRVMLYLGRLWAGKGLDILVKAWAGAIREKSGDDWLLVLAGPDYRNYRPRLLSLIEALGLCRNTFLPGPVAGPMKDSLLATAECLVLPSRGEAFSMALLEAVAARLPVLYTRECNFPELAAGGGGWEVPADAGDIAWALNSVMSQEAGQLREMGRKGWALGREQFTLERVGDGLMKMYKEAIKH